MNQPRDYSDHEPDNDFWHDNREARESLDRFWLGVLVAILHGIAFLIGVGLAMWTYPAFAHQAPTGWAYPFECCSNKDCGEIPASAVVEGPNGFVVTILPGQHDMVKDAPVQYLIPYGTEKPSPDGLTHICLNPALKMLCFFTGNRGV